MKRVEQLKMDLVCLNSELRDIEITIEEEQQKQAEKFKEILDTKEKIIEILTKKQKDLL